MSKAELRRQLEPLFEQFRHALHFDPNTGDFAAFSRAKLFEAVVAALKRRLGPEGLSRIVEVQLGPGATSQACIRGRILYTYTIESGATKRGQIAAYVLRNGQEWAGIEVADPSGAFWKALGGLDHSVADKKRELVGNGPGFGRNQNDLELFSLLGRYSPSKILAATLDEFETRFGDANEIRVEVREANVHVYQGPKWFARVKGKGVFLVRERESREWRLTAKLFRNDPWDIKITSDQPRALAGRQDNRQQVA